MSPEQSIERWRLINDKILNKENVWSNALQQFHTVYEADVKALLKKLPTRLFSLVVGTS